jgi:hypothetical protein
MSDPRFPIGPLTVDPNVTAAKRLVWIAEIESAPAKVRAAVRGLAAAQLDTPYRDGGWTVRQLLHHLPDSHFNALCRLKLALTEANPTIKAYDEAAWARLADYELDPALSLVMLDGIHARFVALWKSLKPADWSRTFHHPEHRKDLSLDWLLQMYAWHGRHHTAHITALRDRMGW